MARISYESVLQDARVRRTLAWRASLLPVTAAALPAALLSTAMIAVTSRLGSGYVPIFAGLLVFMWLAGFILFSRQQEKHFAGLARQSFTYDGEMLAVAGVTPATGGNPDAIGDTTQPQTAGSVQMVGQLGSRLNRGELQPSELPSPGLVPQGQHLKVNKVGTLALLIQGFNGVREVYLSGEFAADGTPVWDLRTRLIKDIEEAAWQAGSLTDPGWHSRPM